jgi:cytidine deaminase
VGAALRASSGAVYTGANVENASYGLTICAERAAVFKAVNEGDRSFREIVLVCDGDAPVPPCGACLQVLKEFAEDLPVSFGNTAGERRETTLKRLLPTPFLLE